MPGKYYEELEVGQHIQHPLRRTVTEMDNVLFSALTMNTQPLHVDEEFARHTQFGQRLGLKPERIDGAETEAG